MSYKLIGAIVFVTLAIYVDTVNGYQEKEVIIDVYYESLCPYSVRFITKQLAPAYSVFKHFIRINFIPFGKASYVIGNPTTFTCQHGPDECEGNRGQACALHVIDRFIQLQDQQQIAMDIVECAMANNNLPSAALKCAAKNGLDKKLYRNIKNCISSNVGDAILIAYGKKTKAFESPLIGVPAVTINGIKNTKAVSNFIQEVCKVIDYREKPQICNNRDNPKQLQPYHSFDYVNYK